MAGAIDVAGNAPGGVAEYNVWVDALAAREVIAGMDVTLVPLDATNDVPFNPYFVRTLEAHLDTPEAEAVATIIEHNEPIFLGEGYSFWDTLATVLVFAEDMATWEEAMVSITVSAGTAGWIDRDAGGHPVRFAADVPDPLAFESEYLSVLTGTALDTTRPEPTLTIAFDGDTCTIEPAEVGAGTNDVVFVNATDREDVGGVLVSFAGKEGPGYEELRRILGPDGSRLDPQNPDIQTVQVLAFVTELTPVEIPAGPFASACFEGRGRAPRLWLSDVGEAV
jgi:hypothetical protein